MRAAVAVVVIGGLGWWLATRGHSDAARPGTPAAAARAGSADARVVPVQVAAAAKRDVPIWLEGLGTVAASQQVTVRSQVDGRLDKVLFTEGQTVKKGDVLAQIDPRPFQVQLHQAQGALTRDKAQLLTARESLVRYRALKDQQLVAAQQVEQYEGQVGQYEGALAMDQAQIESAQLNLDYAQIKSPCDGITGVRQVDAGNLVHTTDANGIVVITAVDPAAVFFTLPEDRLSDISGAQGRGDVQVEVWNRDGTQKLGEGKLAVLDNQINQSTATLRLKALVPNDKRTLWPNEFVKARILVEQRKGALVVPAVAVQQGPQGSFVYVVGPDQTAQLKPVTVALVTGDQAIIDKGLTGGEQVVTEGQNQLRPGGKVAIPSQQPSRGPQASREAP